MVPEAETSDFEELGGMSVERLTVWRKDRRASIANRDGATPLQQTMKITDVIDRLAAIEDILGDEYDLEDLRDALRREQDGRYFDNYSRCGVDSLGYSYLLET